MIGIKNNKIQLIKETKIPKVDDPFKLVEGMLKHLKGKKTSVELQHEAFDLWIAQTKKDKYFKPKP